MGKPSLSEPGIVPVEYRVLVDLDAVEEKTAGGVYIPDHTKERQQMATVNGTVLAAGGMAFTQENGEPWPLVPQPGDSVAMKKYAGEIVKGRDGREYRLIQDKEILGVWRG